jgi:hypothetical protein
MFVGGRTTDGRERVEHFISASAVALAIVCDVL